MILVRKNGYQALSENSAVGPRASVFSPGKDGEAGDVGFIVDTAGCSQAENKPLEARSSFLTQPNAFYQEFRLHATTVRVCFCALFEIYPNTDSPISLTS